MNIRIPLKVVDFEQMSEYFLLKKDTSPRSLFMGNFTLVRILTKAVLNF
jgi:hypothetical protein